MATRNVYKKGSKTPKKVKIDPTRSRTAKKAAKKRKGKPLKPAHRKAISKGLRKSKRR